MKEWNVFEAQSSFLQLNSLDNMTLINETFRTLLI